MEEMNQEPVVAPVAESTPQEVPQKVTDFISGDGSLKEGWSNVLLDEGMRGEKSLYTFKNIKDPFKSFLATKKMVGANVVKIPTDVSTELEWGAYYDAGGRPKTAADYGFKRPDNMPEEHWNEPLAKAAQELMHKIGLSRKQANELFKFNNDNVLAALTNEKNSAEAQEQGIKQELFTRWGNAYDQKLHLGNCAVEEGCGGESAEFRARVLEKINADPDLILFTSNIGSKFTEHKGPKFDAIPTPSDIQSQIDAIEQNPLYLKGTQKQRMELATKAMELRAKLKPKGTT